MDGPTATLLASHEFSKGVEWVFPRCCCGTTSSEASLFVARSRRGLVSLSVEMKMPFETD